MANTTIEIRRRYTVAEEEKITAAVHAAQMEGLGDRYTLVEIDLFSDRSTDAKRRLYKALVRNLGALGIPGDHVKVLLRESATENWGIRGGIPASEVDVGFEIRV